MARVLRPALAALLAPVAAVAAVAVVTAVPATARADKPSGLRVEATLGGGWRTSIDTNDRSPSFEGGGFQLEVALGPVWGDLALLFGARGRAGTVASAADFVSTPGASPPFVSYFETTGNVGVQIAFDDKVRARLGGDVGGVFAVDHRAPVVGGFLAFSFDSASWKEDRIHLILTVRADLQAVLTDDARLPKTSTSFGAGIGIRY